MPKQPSQPNQEGAPVSNLESAKAHVKEAAEQIRAAAETKAHELRERAEAKAQEFRSTAEAKVQEFRERAENKYGEARERTRTYQTDTEAYVRENPTKAVLTAAFVGFLLGLIFRR